jgi:hypothetical protein
MKRKRYEEVDLSTSDRKRLKVQSDFDKKLMEFYSQIDNIKQDMSDYMDRYFLQELLSKEIDYIILNNDKNIDYTKVKVRIIKYMVHFEARFKVGLF